MKVAITTRAERPIPWPDDEPPPALHDQILWDGEIWQVVQIRWALGPALSCAVLVQPLCAMTDADARRR